MAQPVLIEDFISIAANSTNQNVIVTSINPQLRRYLRAPFRARGKFLCVQSAAGLSIDLDYGSKNVISGFQPRISTTLLDPDDVQNDEFFLNEGDQLAIRAVNATGGVVDLRYRLILFPWEDELPPDCRVMGQSGVGISANAVDVQLLDGLRYERPPVDSVLEVFMTASANGLSRQLFVETDSIAPPTLIPPTNRQPTDPFDKTIEGVEVPADKLIQLSISNLTGGSLSFFWKVKLYEQVRT